MGNMGKKAALWLLILALMLPAKGLGEQAITTTILVYLCGSDLESEDSSATDDLQEMIRAGIMPGGPVTLLAETGGAREWHLRAAAGGENKRFQITETGMTQIGDDLGQRNMGAEDTLRDFLAWGLSYAPADRVFLFIWNHGGGPLEGVCYDENYDNNNIYHY